MDGLEDLFANLIKRLEQVEAKLMSFSSDEDDGNDTDEKEDPLMMPPQQQKLELLKKAVGVPSEYDNETTDSTPAPQPAPVAPSDQGCGCGSNNQNELGKELNTLKKNAGITAVLTLTSDDLDLN